jgi:hypothetical protein
MKNKKSSTGSNNNTTTNNNNTMHTTTNTYIQDVVPYLVAYHEQFGSLPTSVIEDVQTGTAVTCFGTNLKNKIERAGSLEKLLTSFTSRLNKQKKEAKTKVDKKVEAVKEEVKTASKRVRPSRSKAATA